MRALLPAWRAALPNFTAARSKLQWNMILFECTLPKVSLLLHIRQMGTAAAAAAASAAAVQPSRGRLRGRVMHAARRAGQRLCRAAAEAAAAGAGAVGAAAAPAGAQVAASRQKRGGQLRAEALGQRLQHRARLRDDARDAAAE